MEHEGAKQIVLVVEDDDQIAYLLRFILEREGFEVKLARDGRSAQRLVANLAPPALVTLDVIMPRMDGPTTLKALRQLPGFATTPVIFMTAKVQPQEVAEYKALGALDMISKPFNPMTLASKLRQMLEGRP